MDLAGRVLHAIADRLLVNINSDVVHSLSRNLHGSFSESASQLSSAFVTPRAHPRLIIQTIQPEPDFIFFWILPTPFLCFCHLHNPVGIYVFQRLLDATGPVDLYGEGFFFRTETEMNRAEAR